MAKCVNMMSSRFGVRIRLLIRRTNTVMFPIADRTIKILRKRKQNVCHTKFVENDGFERTCIRLWTTDDPHRRSYPRACRSAVLLSWLLSSSTQCSPCSTTLDCSESFENLASQSFTMKDVKSLRCPLNRLHRNLIFHWVNFVRCHRFCHCNTVTKRLFASLSFHKPRNSQFSHSIFKIFTFRKLLFFYNPNRFN